MTVLNRGRDGHAKPNEIGHIASKPRRLSHSMPSTTTTTGPQPELPRDAIRGPGAPSVFQGSSHRTSPRRRIDDKVTSELVRAPLYVSHHPWPSRCVGRGTDDERAATEQTPSQIPPILNGEMGSDTACEAEPPGRLPPPKTEGGAGGGPRKKLATKRDRPPLPRGGACATAQPVGLMLHAPCLLHASASCAAR